MLLQAWLLCFFYYNHNFLNRSGQGLQASQCLQIHSFPKVVAFSSKLTMLTSTEVPSTQLTWVQPTYPGS